MVLTNIYLLSAADCAAIHARNRTCPRGPMIIICDYGVGECVEETVINNVLYADWKADLEAILAFTSRSTVQVDITDGL